MNINKRNRITFNLYTVLKSVFDSSSYMFGSLYVYQKLGFWWMLAFGVSLTVTMSFGMFFGDWVIRILHPKKTLFAGTFLVLASYYVFAFYLNSYTVLLLGTILGIGIALTGPANNIMYSMNLDDGKIGKQSSWWSNVNSLVLMAAPLYSVYVISFFGFSGLFKTILVGCLVSIIPLFWYQSSIHTKDMEKHEGLLRDLPKLLKEYNFRSDSWRMFWSAYSWETSLAAVMLLLFILYNNKLETIGWILTGAGFVTLGMKWIMGKRFDDGKINIPLIPSIAEMGGWYGFLFFMGSPIIGTVSKAVGNVASNITGFISSAAFYKNTKDFREKHYSAAVLFLGYLGCIVAYIPLAIVYLATGNLKITLLLCSAAAGIAPVLKYFFYNHQK